MKATTTRTLNPLPFQDLEPRRFEDLVRQLAYDFRAWKSLEATGRAGADDGLDIRGIELAASEPSSREPDAGEDEVGANVEERLWIFQCKREKTLPPKRTRAIIKEIAAAQAEPPYGFVLAVAGDVSKAARDAFREEMVAWGVQIFFVWARSELEDMLFQPRNDSLLFAYFGLSLVPRRRSVTSTLRADIAIKKQLHALLEGEGQRGKLLLFRDPTDDRYPDSAASTDREPRWIACRAIDLDVPGHLRVLRHEFLAATTPDGKGWDYLPQHDMAERRAQLDLHPFPSTGLVRDGEKSRAAYALWSEYIPESDRAHLEVHRGIALSSILAIDPVGDGAFPVPHVFVDFAGEDTPFVDWEWRRLNRPDLLTHALPLRPERENKVAIFGDLESIVGPPPPAFDATLNDAFELSPTAATRLQILLTPRPVAQTPARAGGDEWQRNRERQVGAFRAWRDEIGLPVLSGFVQAMRATGHHARLVSRDVDKDGRDLEQWVELRLRAARSNEGSREVAHLRIAATHSGWAISTSQTMEESRRGQREPAPRLTGAPTKEQVEGQALAFVERMLARDGPSRATLA